MGGHIAPCTCCFGLNLYSTIVLCKGLNFLSIVF